VAAVERELADRDAPCGVNVRIGDAARHASPRREEAVDFLPGLLFGRHSLTWAPPSPLVAHRSLRAVIYSHPGEFSRLVSALDAIACPTDEASRIALLVGQPEQTYRHEVAGGYLWSPKRKSNGT